MKEWTEEDLQILRELYENHAMEREIILTEQVDEYKECEAVGDDVGSIHAYVEYMDVVGETEGLYDLAVEMGAIEEPEEEEEEEEE